MKRQTKLSTEQNEQLASAQQQAGQAAAREFNSVEELLRHDASHTPVPPAIADRLQKSLGPAAAPARPWWRRLFGGGKS